MNGEDRHEDEAPRLDPGALGVRAPAPGLEERVVGALRAEGLLTARGEAIGGAVLVRPRGGHGVLPRRWLLAAAVAGLALFASGVAAGQWLAGGQTAAVVAAALENDPLGRALRVQEAGSAYVQAIVRLSESGAADPEGVGPGREAAGVALHAAALEVARLNPGDEALQTVLRVLDERLRAAATANPGAADGAAQP